jgi:hypothetical protein
MACRFNLVPPHCGFRLFALKGALYMPQTENQKLVGICKIGNYGVSRNCCKKLSLLVPSGKSCEDCPVGSATIFC